MLNSVFYFIFLSPCLLAGSGYSSQPGFSDFPNAPGTPTLGEFSSGPPPLSYQSDLPSGLLTPEKPVGHPMSGQVANLHHLCLGQKYFGMSFGQYEFNIHICHSGLK